MFTGTFALCVVSLVAILLSTDANGKKNLVFVFPRCVEGRRLHRCLVCTVLMPTLHSHKVALTAALSVAVAGSDKNACITQSKRKNVSPNSLPRKRRRKAYDADYYVHLVLHDEMSPVGAFKKMNDERRCKNEAPVPKSTFFRYVKQAREEKSKRESKMLQSATTPGQKIFVHNGVILLNTAVGPKMLQLPKVYPKLGERGKQIRRCRTSEDIRMVDKVNKSYITRYALAFKAAQAALIEQRRGGGRSSAEACCREQEIAFDLPPGCISAQRIRTYVRATGGNYCLPPSHRGPKRHELEPFIFEWAANFLLVELLQSKHYEPQDMIDKIQQLFTAVGIPCMSSGWIWTKLQAAYPEVCIRRKAQWCRDALRIQWVTHANLKLWHERYGVLILTHS